MPVAYNNRQDVLRGIREAEQRLMELRYDEMEVRSLLTLLRTKLLPLYPAAKRAVKKSLVKRKQAKRA